MTDQTETPVPVNRVQFTVMTDPASGKPLRMTPQDRNEAGEWVDVPDEVVSAHVAGTGFVRVVSASRRWVIEEE